MSVPTRCVFCEIVAGEAPAEVVHSWGDAIVIEPLNPVVPGHLLVVSKDHVADALEDGNVTLLTMAAVRRAAQAPCNIITSCGTEATQTVRHLHVHIVPRRDGDGLALPWTGQA